MRASDHRVDVRALLFVVLQPLLVKLPLILNIMKSDPLVRLSGLGSARFLGMPGQTSLDPNVAYTSHALGSYAARTLFQGGALWWNPYEGVGMPLAGELQSAALFPPTWLMILPNGQLFEHLLFQIIAGVATFLLVRRLGLGTVACWFAGTAFSFNGSFAWLANAVVNPICFLPLVLLGVECVRSGASRDRITGICCICLGVAASLYAGFPETAFLDGLLIAGWTLVRASQSSADQPRAFGFLLRAGVPALAGILLAAPLLAAFFDYLAVANVGAHDGGGIRNALGPADFAMFLIPYLPGAITHHPSEFWSYIGGYSGVALFALAFAGRVDGTMRRLRVFLLAWIVIGLCLIYGIEPVATLVGVIPGLRAIVVYRYIEPSMAMAMAVLAALTLDLLSHDTEALRRVRRVFAATLILALIVSMIAVMMGIRPLQKVEALPLAMHLLLLAPLAIAIWKREVEPRARIVAIALCGAIEIVALFAVPMISYPLRRPVDLGTIGFLQRNSGLQRFVSTGPVSLPGSIAANYGSYFSIAQVNWNDLPVPQRWIDYARLHLDRTTDADVLRVSPAQFMHALPSYAAIGTKYVTTPRDTPLPLLREVFADSLMRIYALPGVRPYFSAPGCEIVAADRASLRTRCVEPSRLDRLELFMPGWQVLVNGRAQPIELTAGIFQSVSVPAGEAAIAFRFEPPSVRIGYWLAGLGALLLIGMLGIAWRGARRQGSSDDIARPAIGQAG